jgi:hypothetical protein
MSKVVSTADRKKSFESNFADEVRRLVSVRKKATDVSEAAVRQQQSAENQGIADSILSAGIAKHALTLDAVDPADRLLRDVFAFCALDPTSPWHWRILLEVTIEITFRRSGNREKWNDGAFFELMMDVREVKRLDPSATTDKRVAEFLKKKNPFASKYKMKLSYLTKLVGKANDPRFNSMVKYEDDENFLDVLIERRQEKTGVSTEMASSLVDKIVEEQIEATLARFKKRSEEQGMKWTDAVRDSFLPEVSRIVRAHLTGKDVKQ